MKNADHQNTVVDRLIEDQVRADRKAAQARSVLILGDTQPRALGQTIVGCRKTINDPIGRRGIVASDVTPDVENVGLRLLG